MRQQVQHSASSTRLQVGVRVDDEEKIRRQRRFLLRGGGRGASVEEGEGASVNNWGGGKLQICSRLGQSGSVSSRSSYSVTNQTNGATASTTTHHSACPLFKSISVNGLSDDKPEYHPNACPFPPPPILRSLRVRACGSVPDIPSCLQRLTHQPLMSDPKLPPLPWRVTCLFFWLEGRSC